jgi:glycine cleavage system regulatory protein
LEEQVAALKRASQVDRDELAKLRATVTALDREKDLLQAAVDEKTEMGVKQQETVVVRVSRCHIVFCIVAPYKLAAKYVH